MSKLTLEDVKIIGEGPQIKKAISEKYNSPKDFYERFKVTKTYTTFASYLSKEVITSHTFKCSITIALDVDFPSLFVTRQKQIKKHVQSIYENIRQYNQESDLPVLDYLLEQCKKENLSTETSMMYRAKARNYYYTNRIHHCEEFYNCAVETLPEDEINKKIYFQCELADDLFRENLIEKSEKNYKYIEQLVQLYKSKLDSSTLFYYHYWRGISYMLLNKDKKARELFKTAAEYAEKTCEKAGVVANIGLTYKKSGQYDKALVYYQEASNYQDETRTLITAEIYNYMAMLYKAVKDYANAIEYISKALDIAEKQHDLVCKLCYTATYVEIQLEMGNTKAYKSYFDALSNTKYMQIYSKPYLVKDIKTFIKYINDIQALNELINIIIELMQASASCGYTSGLIDCKGYAEIKIQNLTKEGIL